ncbi:hypothetical protein Q3G72_006449 [Acer saccharum]|nr:hypothetical protein Q3G72_006449 [Acer saccharum]
MEGAVDLLLEEHIGGSNARGGSLVDLFKDAIRVVHFALLFDASGIWICNMYSSRGCVGSWVMKKVVDVVVVVVGGVGVIVVVIPFN